MYIYIYILIVYISRSIWRLIWCILSQQTNIWIGKSQKNTLEGYSRYCPTKIGANYLNWACPKNSNDWMIRRDTISNDKNEYSMKGSQWLSHCDKDKYVIWWLNMWYWLCSQELVKRLWRNMGHTFWPKMHASKDDQFCMSFALPFWPIDL